ncbi:MAG: 30S ribosomal protein S20 [Candidatus Peribacteraceae bacterium]|nr:30S ribosomal protein S20 [Candidatus Peribacteraceae bacterium]
MPILQSSIKSARQSEERRARRQPFKTNMKTEIRRIHDLVKEGKKDEALKALSKAFKAIDTAEKKNLIHWKNAARKKSSLSRMTSPKK